MKYRNKPITIDYHRFPSRKEAARYLHLKQLLTLGLITNLELQPSYPITINGIKICKVILDFRYTERGKEIIEDSKGFDTPMSKIKRRMVEAAYGIKVVLV